MREVIMTGKTVEEATERALSELGLSAEEVTVEVIDLPQKKLFKTIPAKVRVSADETEEKAQPAPAPAPVQQKQAPAAPVSPAPGAAPAAAAPAPAQSEPAPAQEDRAAETYEEIPIDLASDERASAAAAYLREVCAKMGVPNIEIEAVKQGETTILKVEGEGTGMLIGHRGEVMEALSYLCSLVANRSGGEYVKFGLDINHYRAKREANLTALAKRIGAKVAHTGRSHTLEPMNPYERRIIHSAISAMDGVKSESTGEGTGRRVVIMSTDPAAAQRSAPRGGRDSGRPGRDRGPRRDGAPREGRDSRDSRDSRGGRPPRGPRREGGFQKSSVPAREFADKPRDPSVAPTVPKRTETINDGAELPLFGKIEL